MAKKEKDACELAADNRAAQKKFQDKQPPGAQAKAVKKSEAKNSTKGGAGKPQSSKVGTRGGKIGRPRKDC